MKQKTKVTTWLKKSILLGLTAAALGAGAATVQAAAVYVGEDKYAPYYADTSSATSYYNANGKLVHAIYVRHGARYASTYYFYESDGEMWYEIRADNRMPEPAKRLQDNWFMQNVWHTVQGYF